MSEREKKQKKGDEIRRKGGKTSSSKSENVQKGQKSSSSRLGFSRLPGNVFVDSMRLPQRVVGQIADEVVKRLRIGEGVHINSSEGIENAVFLDTSAIIDGRVFDLVELGVFSGPFVLVSGVLSELKNIADSKDPVKRERGRVSLSQLEKFKREHKKNVITIDTDSTRAVDDEIVYQAKIAKGRVITCDFNLTKKARIEGVVAVDLYEVANVLKTPAIPGDQFKVEVIQKGKGEAQGVGYLSDGTMIVVEEGEHLIGETVNVIVTRVIQTEAGKIFFGRTAPTDE